MEHLKKDYISRRRWKLAGRYKKMGKDLLCHDLQYNVVRDMILNEKSPFGWTQAG